MNIAYSVDIRLDLWGKLGQAFFKPLLLGIPSKEIDNEYPNCGASAPAPSRVSGIEGGESH